MKKYRKIPVVIDAVELKFTPYSIKKYLQAEKTLTLDLGFGVSQRRL